MSPMSEILRESQQINAEISPLAFTEGCEPSSSAASQGPGQRIGALGENTDGEELEVAYLHFRPQNRTRKTARIADWAQFTNSWVLRR